MSNPDASAGPYASNEKKPIGGNIMAHASTTRYDILPLLRASRPTFFIDSNSRKPAGVRERARSTTRLVFQRWRRSLLFSAAVLETLKRRPRLLCVIPIDFNAVVIV
jgi:hypothetical protein